MHNNGGHSYEAKVRLLDDRDNGLDILQLAYMDHTMGMVIMLPRVKTNTWQATKSWRPRNLLAATPLARSQYLTLRRPTVTLLSQGNFRPNFLIKVYKTKLYKIWVGEVSENWNGSLKCSIFSISFKGGQQCFP